MCFPKGPDVMGPNERPGRYCGGKNGKMYVLIIVQTRGEHCDTASLLVFFPQNYYDLPLQVPIHWVEGENMF